MKMTSRRERFLRPQQLRQIKSHSETDSGQWTHEHSQLGNNQTMANSAYISASPIEQQLKASRRNMCPHSSNAPLELTNMLHRRQNNSTLDSGGSEIAPLLPSKPNGTFCRNSNGLVGCRSAHKREQENNLKKKCKRQHLNRPGHSWPSSSSWTLLVMIMTTAILVLQQPTLGKCKVYNNKQSLGDGQHLGVVVESVVPLHSGHTRPIDVTFSPLPCLFLFLLFLEHTHLEADQN